MEALHLTEENRECLRALVRQITPDFEEELWDRLRVRIEKERAAQAALEEMQRRAQYQQAGQGMMGTTTITTTGVGAVGAGYASPLFGNVVPNTPPLTIYANSTAAVPPPSIYQSVGTGFTTYGPIDPNQGLTLNKWVGYDDFLC